MTKKKTLFILWSFLVISPGSDVFARTAEFEYQLDAYYTAIDYYIGLTDRPIPYYNVESERDLYKKLFLSSPIPRFVVFEASVNPMPLLGVYLKRQASSLYEDAQLSDDLNIIQSVTTGFEEPAAVSIFLGNVIDFNRVKKKSYGEGKGYKGYLISAGNYHIKDNDLIKDNWWEGEWKVKGERKNAKMKLAWSFRLGIKNHADAEIADVFYVGIRRGRTDYEHRKFSWFKNSGIMYKYDFSSKNFNGIQHHFVVDKKFPLPKGKMVPTLALGFIVRTRDKYSGSLNTEDRKEFRLVFQPNVEF